MSKYSFDNIKAKFLKKMEDKDSSVENCFDKTHTFLKNYNDLKIAVKNKISLGLEGLLNQDDRGVTAFYFIRLLTINDENDLNKFIADIGKTEGLEDFNDEVRFAITQIAALIARVYYQDSHEIGIKPGEIMVIRRKDEKFSKDQRTLKTKISNYTKQIIKYCLADLTSNIPNLDELRETYEIFQKSKVASRRWLDRKLYINQEHKSLEPVTSIVESKALLREKKDDEKDLNFAIVYGTLEDVEKLIKAGADVNKVDAVNGNALFEAVQYRQLNIVKLLLEAGADPNW
jgi:hypothetical protein